MINLQRERPTCHDCHLFHLTPNYALVRYVLPNFWPLPDTTFLLHGPNVSGISKSPYKLATVFENHFKSLTLQICERSELNGFFEFSRQKFRLDIFVIFKYARWTVFCSDSLLTTTIFELSWCNTLVLKSW